MGRGNYYASGDYAAQWYVNYEHDIPEDEFISELVKKEVMYQIATRYPSFWETDIWIRRDSRALLENQLFYVGIADNENNIAVFLSSKDEGGVEGLTARHFAAYRKGVLDILLDLFGEVYLPTGSWTSRKISLSSQDLQTI